MIRINLLGEKEDKSGVYAIQVLTFLGTLAVAVLSCFFLYAGTSTKLEFAKEETLTLESKLKDLREKTKEVDDLEKKRKLVREKLSTIAALKANKHGPVHVITELTTTIPEKAWLTAAKEKDGRLSLSGIALDNQTIAEFMKRLEESPYFGAPELVISKEHPYEGVALTEFSLSVPIENLLKMQQQIQKADAENKAKVKE